MKAEGIECNAFRQCGSDQFAENEQQIFGSGLARENCHPFVVVFQLFHHGKRGFVAQEQRMIHFSDNILIHNAFQFAKINNHALFRGGKVGLGNAFHGNIQLVGVAMDVAAWSIIARKRMGHFKSELFGQANFHNRAV